MITNRDLFEDPDGPRTDHVYVVTQPPIVNGKTVTVRVDLDAVAAVHDSYAAFYPHQPPLTTIADGNGESWLLSGGALITNEADKIAVGLRDGNARDPFMFTNVAAGRCDRRLEHHCYEETATEFILCVKSEGDVWRQVEFGSRQLLLCNLNKPAVKKRVTDVLASVFAFGALLSPPPLSQRKALSTRSSILGIRLPTDIVVEWFDRQEATTERLEGYVFVDQDNKTTEFRLAIPLDLTPFVDNEVFFGEGTGHAEWLSLDDIRALAAANSRRELVTPFLKQL